MTQRYARTLSRTTFSFLIAAAALTAYAIPAAQPAAKKSLTIDDYTKWRTIADSALSGDGRWITYTLQQANTIQAESRPVLHLRNLQTNEEVKVEHASGGTFSPDSK